MSTIVRGPTPTHTDTRVARTTDTGRGMSQGVGWRVGWVGLGWEGLGWEVGLALVLGMAQNLDPALGQEQEQEQ